MQGEGRRCREKEGGKEKGVQAREWRCRETEGWMGRGCKGRKEGAGGKERGCRSFEGIHGKGCRSKEGGAGKGRGCRERGFPVPPPSPKGRSSKGISM